MREIVKRYKALQKKLSTVAIFDDSEVVELKAQAGKALDDGDFDSAERLLNAASAKGVQCANRIEKETRAVRKCRLSAAESKADAGDLKYTQFKYKEAAEYFKEAAELVPDSEKLVRSRYLNKCGYAFQNAGMYAEAQGPYEQALKILNDKLGPDHPNTKTVKANYDIILKKLVEGRNHSTKD